MFGALIVLTVVTVGVSELGIPQPYSLILAMIVATCKAALVVTFFMHLLWDERLNTVVFLGTVVFVAIFFSLTMTDLLSRDFFDKGTGNFVMLEEEKKVWHECMETGTYDSCRDKLPRGWFEANPDAAAHGEHGGDHGAEGDHGDAGHDAKGEHGAEGDHGDKKDDGGH